jgi:RHS repeat-associated protein
MNGRVYDPVIARFLSPDPFVQFPGVADGYNRYSYVMNNPLVYTDPDGEFIWFVIGGAIL